MGRDFGSLQTNVQKVQKQFTFVGWLYHARMYDQFLIH